MSDIGAVSHAYAEWNSYLGGVNRWLLQVRKSKEGLLPKPNYVEIPDDVRHLLLRIADSLVTTDERPASSIPLTIKQRLESRLQGQIDESQSRLHRLLRLHHIALEEITPEDVDLLRNIVISLDDEVASLYNRMRSR